MNIAQALSELDLRPGATEQEIRSAYRTLVAKWHPDKHQNDPIRLREAELRIKNINRAFEALQKAGFRTEKPSGKGRQKTEKPKGQSQSKSPEPPEVPKDGASERKAQKQPDDKPVKGRRERQRWPIGLSVGAVVLFLAGFLLGESYLRRDVNELEQQLSSKETKLAEAREDLREAQEALGNNKKISDGLLSDLEQLKKDKREINDDLNQVIKENTAMHEKIDNLELTVSDLATTVSDLEKTELGQTGHQEKLAYAKAFIKEATEEDEKKTVIDLVMSLVPPRDNDLSQKIAEAYFKEIDSDKQNKVLEECFADHFGFTARGIEGVLKGEKWRFYWEGLANDDWAGQPTPDLTFYLNENRQVVSRRAIPDGTWKVPDVNHTDLQQDRKEKLEEYGNWRLRLRWVLQEGDETQHFPVADLDQVRANKVQGVVGGNPFGNAPQFRGWFLNKTNKTLRDRAIGLKLNNSVAVVAVDAAKSVGYSLGPISKGEKIVIRYKGGVWADGKSGLESPDATVKPSLKLCLESIANDSGEEVLVTVRNGTKNNPYVCPLAEDMTEVRLRMNDEQDSFSDNIGIVAYEVQVVPAPVVP